MGKIPLGLEGGLCYMDDVLIYVTDASQHWTHLQKVLDKISNSALTLKREKCEIGSSSVKFLGHVISSKGISPNPHKK